MTAEEPIVPDVFTGRVAWIFGDDFDVDLVIGVENIKYYDPDVLREACMKTFDTSFVDDVRPGDIVVGGRNFGYGHPHYPAMIALRNAGIVAVVAESFSPGFWRGEIYQGMPLVTCPGISSAVRRWDKVSVRWRDATIAIEGRDEPLIGEALSPRAVRVIEAGGSYNLLLREHAQQPSSHA